MSYTLAAWRAFREQREQGAHTVPRLESAGAGSLAAIPPEAPMEASAVVGVWDGERFIDWKRWRATRPIAMDPEATS